MLPDVHKTFKIYVFSEIRCKYFGLLLSMDFSNNNSDSYAFSEK